MESRRAQGDAQVTVSLWSDRSDQRWTGPAAAELCPWERALRGFKRGDAEHAKETCKRSRNWLKYSNWQDSGVSGLYRGAVLPTLRYGPTMQLSILQSA